MKVFYLSGGMTNLTFEESNGWRETLAKYFAEDRNVALFNPNNHWSFDNPDISDKEAMEYDLHRLRHSDLMIVNFYEFRRLLAEKQLFFIGDICCIVYSNEREAFLKEFAVLNRSNCTGFKRIHLVRTDFEINSDGKRFSAVIGNNITDFHAPGGVCMFQDRFQENRFVGITHIHPANHSHEHFFSIIVIYYCPAKLICCV